MNKKIALQLIKKFVKDLQIGCNIQVKLGDLMECEIADEIVYVDLTEFTNPDEFKKQAQEYWKQYNEQRGYKTQIHMGTWAILHEIGHIVASYDYDDLDETLENDAFARKVLEMKTYENVKDMLDIYKTLKLEIDADEMAWALYQANTEIVIDLDKKLTQLV